MGCGWVFLCNVRREKRNPGSAFIYFCLYHHTRCASLFTQVSVVYKKTRETRLIGGKYILVEALFSKLRPRPATHALWRWVLGTTSREIIKVWQATLRKSHERLNFFFAQALKDAYTGDHMEGAIGLNYPQFLKHVCAPLGKKLDTRREIQALMAFAKRCLPDLDDLGAGSTEDSSPKRMRSRTEF
jgi:hypothetical protein